MKTLPYGGFVTRRRFTGPYPDLRHCFFRIQDSQQGVKQRLLLQYIPNTDAFEQ